MKCARRTRFTVVDEAAAKRIFEVKNPLPEANNQDLSRRWNEGKQKKTSVPRLWFIAEYLDEKSRGPGKGNEQRAKPEIGGPGKRGVPDPACNADAGRIRLFNHSREKWKGGQSRE